MVLRLIGQLAPGATTDTAFSGFNGSQVDHVEVKSLIVCNRGGASTTFRVRHAVANGAASNEQYWFYDTPILANDTLTLAIDAGVAPNDGVWVYAGNANLSFSIYGYK